jgi:alpha-amylase
VVDQYLGANTSVQTGSGTVFFGINSLLDFRLAQGEGGGGLRDVIKGFRDPATLFERLASQNNRALNHGEIGRYLVTFVDNHDAFWQKDSGRIGAGAPDEQVIAAIGFLLCALGTACIYYGTEQGFDGKGEDNDIREAMFDKATPGKNLLNSDCRIYQEISKIARVLRTTEALRFGRMYYRQISADHKKFDFPFGSDYTLAFSRLLAQQEVVVAYNVSGTARTDGVVVDGVLHPAGRVLSFLYGGTGTVMVQQTADGTCFVPLDLAPHQFVILA